MFTIFFVGDVAFSSTTTDAASCCHALCFFIHELLPISRLCRYETKQCFTFIFVKLQQLKITYIAFTVYYSRTPTTTVIIINLLLAHIPSVPLMLVTEYWKLHKQYFCSKDQLVCLNILFNVALIL